MRPFILLAAIGCLCLVGSATGADGTALRPLRTKVLFFFDTEDYTDDRSNDAIRDLANILHAEGVRGQFAMAGELGNFIPQMGRRDVIDALKHHLIGSQTRYHSKYPTINEYGDIPDYAEAYRRTYAEEKIGFDDLLKGLGCGRLWCSVFPGPSNSYVGLYVHSELGSPFFGGGNQSFQPGERDAAWFVNQFHLPYEKKCLLLESFIPPKPMVDLPAALDLLAKREIVTLYMHPHMALNKQHWDAVNLLPGHEMPWGQWRKAEPRTEEDIRGFYERFRTVVRTLVRDVRFDVTDCEKLHASFRPRQTISAGDLPQIRRSLERRLGPIGESWCVSDVFQAAVKLLRGEKTHLPGRVYGFLEPPCGVAHETVLATSDLKAAAMKIDLSTFIPSSIDVGGTAVGPADFLFAALEALETGAESVRVVPRDQLGPIRELMPSLATFSTVGWWSIYHADYKDTYMTPRLRLQLWTLRYENLRSERN